MDKGISFEVKYILAFCITNNYLTLFAGFDFNLDEKNT